MQTTRHPETNRAQQIMASMGVGHSRELQPRQLRRRIGHMDTRSYAELFDSLAPGELLADPPGSCAQDWKDADPDHFGID